MLADGYEQIDRDIADGRVAWTRDLAIEYAQGVRWHRLAELVSEVKEISMLGLETLLMCRAFALSSRTGILEIGPYIGGSTIALGMGLEAAGRGGRIVSVDHGGSYPDKSPPTMDVHVDWRKNLAHYGVSDRATLVPGLSYDKDIVDQVERLSAGEKFDVLLLDADGDVEVSLQTYGNLLADDCLLIIDDYFNVRGGAEDKMDRCTAQLHELMRIGAAHQYVLVPWGTWFGRLNKAALT